MQEADCEVRKKAAIFSTLCTTSSSPCRVSELGSRIEEEKSRVADLQSSLKEKERDTGVVREKLASSEAKNSEQVRLKTHKNHSLLQCVLCFLSNFIQKLF